MSLRALAERIASLARDVADEIARLHEGLLRLKSKLARIPEIPLFVIDYHWTRSPRGHVYYYFWVQVWDEAEKRYRHQYLGFVPPPQVAKMLIDHQARKKTLERARSLTDKATSILEGVESTLVSVLERLERLRRELEEVKKSLETAEKLTDDYREYMRRARELLKEIPEVKVDLRRVPRDVRGRLRELQRKLAEALRNKQVEESARLIKAIYELAKQYIQVREREKKEEMAYRRVVELISRVRR